MIEYLIERGRGLVISIATTLSGYIPSLAEPEQINLVSEYFQIGAWFLTIIVAVLTVWSWCQKQRDRWHDRHPKEKE